VLIEARALATRCTQAAWRTNSVPFVTDSPNAETQEVLVVIDREIRRRSSVSGEMRWRRWEENLIMRCILLRTYEGKGTTRKGLITGYAG